MTIRLRRGDSRTLTFAELADAAGVTLSNFLAGDVVTFTLRHEVTDSRALLTITSDAGGITYTAASTTGSVAIAPADWPHEPPERNLYGCRWDVQRTRGGFVTTVLDGTLDVLADVTR